MGLAVYLLRVRCKGFGVAAQCWQCGQILLAETAPILQATHLAESTAIRVNPNEPVQRLKFHLSFEIVFLYIRIEFFFVSNGPIKFQIMFPLVIKYGKAILIFLIGLIQRGT